MIVLRTLNWQAMFLVISSHDTYCVILYSLTSSISSLTEPQTMNHCKPSDDSTIYCSDWRRILTLGWVSKVWFILFQCVQRQTSGSLPADQLVNRMGGITSFANWARNWLRWLHQLFPTRLSLNSGLKQAEKASDLNQLNDRQKRNILPSMAM